MSFLIRIGGQSLAVAFALAIFSLAIFAQQTTGTLHGQVVDQLGGTIVGATIAFTDANSLEKVAITNGEGSYELRGLMPGRYRLRAAAPGFVTTESEVLEVAPGNQNQYNITLGVTIEKAEVTLAGNGAALNTEADNNANAIVLREEDLEAFPDDPEELASTLQALAGPSAGPNGGQLFIDGFTGGRMPPKESIREVRINQNPFSTEYDRLGFGRIEILTKPGTNKIRGQGFYNFSDESLNSRNPFAPTRAPYQMRVFGGNFSGRLIAKRASFFVDFTRREIDDNDSVNAVVLDSALNITPFNQAVLTPNRGMTFSPPDRLPVEPLQHAHGALHLHALTFAEQRRRRFLASGASLRLIEH